MAGRQAGFWDVEQRLRELLARNPRVSTVSR